MTNIPDDDVRRLWKTQSEESPVLLNEIRAKAATFEKQVWWRNLLEYGAAVIVVAAFSRLLWIASHALVRAGAALIVLATVYVVYRIHRYASVTAMPELALMSCRDFHRRQLTRQRDLLRSIWVWYLLPFVPGLLLLLIGRAAGDPGRAPQVAMSAMISVLMFLGIGWLNQRAARKLDREIEALETAG